MYESPIKVAMGDLQMQVEGEICRAVQTIGVKIDKEELLKALQYDRGQHDKGYKDGIKEFAARLKTRITPHDFCDCFHALALSSAFIDELVKEMTEDKS
ncbi:MAG: hypothetical protein IJY73_06325 [Oscillospiraceae bacterium]|nr:hypothetical protein [Oscillospiraceae bacterium]